MEEFDFQVEHRSGIKHGNADAVSRRPCHVKSCFCRQGGKVEDEEQSRATVTVSDRSEDSAVFSQAVSASSTADGDVSAVESWSLEALRAAQEKDCDMS